MYLSVSLGQESGCVVDGSSASGSQKAPIMVLVKTTSLSEGSAGQGSKPLWLSEQFSSEGLASSLAVGSRPHRLFAMWVSPAWPLASPTHTRQEGSRESLLAAEVTIWCILSQWASRHLCRLRPKEKKKSPTYQTCTPAG